MERKINTVPSTFLRHATSCCLLWSFQLVCSEMIFLLATACIQSAPIHTEVHTFGPMTSQCLSLSYLNYPYLCIFHRSVPSYTHIHEIILSTTDKPKLLSQVVITLFLRMLEIFACIVYFVSSKWASCCLPVYVHSTCMDLLCSQLFFCTTTDWSLNSLNIAVTLADFLINPIMP